jgi:quercetin 2,3-dioxygenase
VSATVQIRRAADRPVTTTSWLTSRHSFSFGDHYDPSNTHHGLLLVSNDDVVAPATGFDTHSHRDMEIVTWVLDGSLEHRDSAGNSGMVYPGLAQRMSAGSGISHSEKNASSTEPVRFVQMWVRPDVAGIEPGYQHHEISADQLEGQLVAIASGMPGQDAAITIHNRSAALHVARLRPGDDVPLPSAPYLHLFVARGKLTMADAELTEGDAVRLTVSAGVHVAAVESAEILVWEMHAALGD